MSIPRKLFQHTHTQNHLAGAPTSLAKREGERERQTERKSKREKEQGAGRPDWLGLCVFLFFFSDALVKSLYRVLFCFKAGYGSLNFHFIWTQLCSDDVDGQGDRKANGFLMCLSGALGSSPIHFHLSLPPLPPVITTKGEPPTSFSIPALCICINALSSPELQPGWD